MKKLVTLLLCVALLCGTAVIPASASPTKEEISPSAGAILEGIFSGKTIETEATDRYDMGAQFGMHFPEFVWVGDTLYNYYIRWHDGKSCVGLATSTDGINFRDYGPVITPSEDYDAEMSSFAGAWYEDGIFYVTYEATPLEGGADIALATSTDGIHFEKKGVILKHDRTLDWQNYNIGTPDLYKVDDTWFMTFHGFGSGKKDCQIGLAFGTDLMDLTMEREPIITTSDDPNDPDCGTCGRRDVIYYDGWYYMAYEIATDGGADGRNLGDGLGVPGRKYYDFGGSNWCHTFARSKDFFTWEKAPAPLHESYQGNYAYDGPAWMIMGDDVYLYYRDVNVRTDALKLTLDYSDVTDRETGVTVETKNDASLSVDSIREDLAESLDSVPGITDYSAYHISMTRGGENFEPSVSTRISLPVPTSYNPEKNTLSVHRIDNGGQIGDAVEFTVSDDNKIVFAADSIGSFVVTVNISLVLGDANLSGKVEINDALMALQATVKKTELDKNEAFCADVTKNGSVEINDALEILQFTVKKINRFSGEAKS